MGAFLRAMVWTSLRAVTREDEQGVALRIGEIHLQSRVEHGSQRLSFAVAGEVERQSAAIRHSASLLPESRELSWPAYFTAAPFFTPSARATPSA
jgi:hypothetical protein